MSAGTGTSSGNIGKMFDMTGKKYAYIFAYDSPTPSKVEDMDLICSTLEGLGFQIVNDCDPPENNDDFEGGDMKSEYEDDALHSDDEQSNYDKQPAEKTIPKYNASVTIIQRPKDLADFMKIVAGEAKAEEAAKGGVSCILLYFVAPQVEYDMVNAENKPLPLFQIWKEFKGVKCPKLFILQANVNENSKTQTVLLNADADGINNSKYFTLPESANMLLAYLPNSGNEQTSVAKILNEELSKPFEINTVMTTVIDRLKSQDCKSCPKFSSTLIEQLYFMKGKDGPREKELPVYTCRRNTCLVYAFLFGSFYDQELSDLNFLIPADSKNLNDTFTKMGFELEFCVPNGHMTLREFHAKLFEIVHNKEKLESCDSIMIVMSSHGGENHILHAYDGCFSLEKVWNALSECKELEGKPKVLAVDACRGTSHELPVKHKVESSFSKEQSNAPQNPEDKIPKTENSDMSDVLIVLASTEGMKSYGTEKGSYLIRHLCETLNDHGKENFLTIINSTMYKVAHTYIKDEDDKTYFLIPVKQQVTFTSTLRKLLHLPGKNKDK